MYRLPNGGSGNALQKAISRELINAFTVVFEVTISENDISLTGRAYGLFGGKSVVACPYGLR